MRGPRPLFLLFAALLLVVPAFAQSPSTAPTTSDPQAVALLQKSFAALTGGATVTDVTLTGTARRIAGSDDEMGTATLTAMVGGYSRVSLRFPSGPRAEVRNPTGTPLPDALPSDLPATVTAVPQPVGAWSGSDNVLHPLVQDNLGTDATWFFPAFTVGNLLSQGYVLSYVGSETLGGQAVVHISAIQQFAGLSSAPPQVASLLQHLTQMDIYLDPATLLPVMLAFNAHSDTNASVDIPVRIRFSGYQAIGGVQVPFEVGKYLNSSLALDLQFDTATLNSGLTAAQFDLQ